MTCEQCVNCTVDYNGNLYCYIGYWNNLFDEDMEEDGVELFCIDFESKENQNG